MKTKTTIPTPHTKTDINPSAAADKSAVRHTFTLGLDVDLRAVVVATQCDQGVIPPARKLSRAQLVAWVKAQVTAGHTVRTVYECCDFGYTLHEQLSAAGAHGWQLCVSQRSAGSDRRRVRPAASVSGGPLA